MEPTRRGKIIIIAVAATTVVVYTNHYSLFGQLCRTETQLTTGNRLLNARNKWDFFLQARQPITIHQAARNRFDQTITNDSAPGRYGNQLAGNISTSVIARYHSTTYRAAAVAAIDRWAPPTTRKTARLRADNLLEETRLVGQSITSCWQLSEEWRPAHDYDFGLSLPTIAASVTQMSGQQRPIWI